ncbi:hypothetical protein [Sinorhizobium fredii]|uniref:hypothetical protein n=1 Tax=Rhizobium fredii TaxID=380 RepID=UPI003511A20E
MALIWFVLMLVLGIFQLAAFQAGLDDWLGFHWVVSIIIGGVALMMGPLGGLAVAVVGFFGAMEAWDWEWWQAGLLCFPSLVLFVVITAVDGTVSLGGMLLNRRR